MSVRLISYNLMNGGEGRADPLAEVILGQRADVVGVHEATDEDVLARLARRLSMEFVTAECDGGRVALFTRGRIVSSVNVGLLHHATTPILDVEVLVNGQQWMVRVAHLTSAGEADRMAGRLRDGVVPMAMLMSHDPPIGHRVVDGVVVRSTEPIPVRTHAPVRQLDEVLVRPDLRVIETWVEQDRLAYYASDHLPAGAEVDWP